MARVLGSRQGPELLGLPKVAKVPFRVHKQSFLTLPNLEEVEKFCLCPSGFDSAPTDLLAGCVGTIIQRELPCEYDSTERAAHGHRRP